MSKSGLFLAGLAVLALSVPAMAEAPKGPPAAKPGEARGMPSPELVIKELDKNKDGALSVEEFLASPRCTNKDIGKEIFKRLDASHDGKLTLQELKDAHEKMQARFRAIREQHAKAKPAPGPQGPKPVVRPLAGRGPIGPTAGRGPMPGRGPMGPMAGKGPIPGRGPMGPMAGKGPVGPPKGIAPTIPSAEEIFKRIDKDNDGKLSLDEFRGVHARLTNIIATQAKSRPMVGMPGRPGFAPQGIRPPFSGRPGMPGMPWMYRGPHWKPGFPGMTGFHGRPGFPGKPSLHGRPSCPGKPGCYGKSDHHGKSAHQHSKSSHDGKPGCDSKSAHHGKSKHDGKPGCHGKSDRHGKSAHQHSKAGRDAKPGKCPVTGKSGKCPVSGKPGAPAPKGPAPKSPAPKAPHGPHGVQGGPGHHHSPHGGPAPEKKPEHKK